jgi:two-component system OmpR family response regulator
MSYPALKSILYAEDEDDIRAIAQIALEDIGGFTVRYCSDGAQALKEIHTFRPDLFLLDVMMPGMDGPSTLRELRKIEGCAEIPVIFMTAKIQREEIIEYKELGAIEVIAKPFDPLALADLIQKAWGTYHE